MEISLKNAVGDLFKTEKKWMTLLLLSVCQLIPIVGPIVAMGYLFRRFAGVRNGLAEQDFKFDDFGEFLQIGLWPFLSSLVVGVCAVPIIFLAYTPMLLLMIDPESMPIIIVATILVIILYLLIFGFIMAISVPVMLRSGLMMDFKAGFSKHFILGFAKKVGVSLFLWLMALGVLAIIPAILGYFALIVGVYVVVTIISFAQMHLIFQHYDLYLELGGTKIEVNPEVLSNNTSTPPLPQTGDQV